MILNVNLKKYFRNQNNPLKSSYFKNLQLRVAAKSAGKAKDSSLY